MVESFLVARVKVSGWSGHQHVDPPRSFSTPAHEKFAKKSLKKILPTRCREPDPPVDVTAVAGAKDRPHRQGGTPCVS